MIIAWWNFNGVLIQYTGDVVYKKQKKHKKSYLNCILDLHCIFFIHLLIPLIAWKFRLIVMMQLKFPEWLIIIQCIFKWITLHKIHNCINGGSVQPNRTGSSPIGIVIRMTWIGILKLVSWGDLSFGTKLLSIEFQWV